MNYTGYVNMIYLGLQQTLRSFEQEISDLKREEEIEARGKKLKHYRGDSNVPYPRISGARFCKNRHT